MLIGLMLAVLLHSKAAGMKWSRGIFLVPMSIPPIAVAIVWRLLFTPVVPGVNYILSLIGIRGPAWFDNPVTAMSSIIIAYTWKWIPFVMIIVLAALESLPEDPFESAVIDGANGWQIFFLITLPMLRPTLLFVATYRAIESMKLFALVYVMTSGGPGVSTEPMNYYAYATSFQYNKMGYGATLVCAILLIIILVVFLMTRLGKMNLRRL
jgi:multiple sugar transport system permease protein